MDCQLLEGWDCFSSFSSSLPFPLSVPAQCLVSSRYIMGNERIRAQGGVP